MIIYIYMYTHIQIHINLHHIYIHHIIISRMITYIHTHIHITHMYIYIYEYMDVEMNTYTYLYSFSILKRAGLGVLGPLQPCAEAPAELRGSAADGLRGPGAGRAGGLCHWDSRGKPWDPRVNHL